MNTLRLWLVRAKLWWATAVAMVLNISFVIAHAATAGNTPDSGVYVKQDLGVLLCNVIAIMFWILIVVSVIMIIMAGFQYVMAGDDTEKTSKARKTLTYAAIGIAVGILASGVPQIVSSIFPAFQGNVNLGSSCTPF